MKNAWQRLKEAWANLPRSTKLLLAALLLVGNVALWYVGLYLPAQVAEAPTPVPSTQVIEAPRSRPSPPRKRPSHRPKPRPKRRPRRPLLPKRRPRRPRLPPWPGPSPRPRTPSSPWWWKPHPHLRPPPPAPRPSPRGPPSGSRPPPKPPRRPPPPGPSPGPPAPSRRPRSSPRAVRPPAPGQGDAAQGRRAHGARGGPLPGPEEKGAEKAPTPASPLERLVAEKGLRLSGTLLGPVSVAILESKEGYLVVPAGSPIPGTEAVVRQVEEGSVTLALKEETLSLSLVQAGGGQ